MRESAGRIPPTTCKTTATLEKQSAIDESRLRELHHQFEQNEEVRKRPEESDRFDRQVGFKPEHLPLLRGQPWAPLPEIRTVTFARATDETGDEAKNNEAETIQKGVGHCGGLRSSQNLSGAVLS